MTSQKLNFIVLIILLSLSTLLNANIPKKYQHLRGWDKISYSFKSHPDLSGFINIIFKQNVQVNLSHPLDQLLPPSDWMTGWQWEAKPQYYAPDNLFEYINGSADLYLSYDFEALVTITFVNENELFLVVDIYDMGQPLNAFGAYSNFRSPGGNYKSIGTEAIVSEYYIRFFQGRYIVDLNASDANKTLSQFMIKTAQEISQRIDAPKESPKILTLLPQEKLIDKTTKYISTGLLGHQFLPRGLEAKYQLDAGEVKAFIVLCGSRNDSEQALTSLSQYISEKGEEFEQIQKSDQTLISGKMPYHDYALAAKFDRFVYGVIDLPKAEAGFELMEALQRQIKSNMKIVRLQKKME